MMDNLKPEVQIRLLSKEDSLEELTELLNRSYKKLAGQGFRFLASHQDVEITKKRIAKGKCFVATMNGKICGTICFYSFKKFPYLKWYENRSVASCGQFAVEEKFQHQGIGNKLIGFVENLALEEGAEEMAVDTAEGASGLIKFYEGRGYRFVAFAQWETTNYLSVILSKKL